MSRIKTPSKPNDITTKILVDLEKAMGRVMPKSCVLIN